MSVLVVGISHNSAPMSLLERVALDEDGVHKLVADAASCEHVTEATVIATCNRLEIYTEVERFHGSIEQISRLLVEQAGETTEAMLPHLYVHYDDGAISHLFQVAAGLDSMAVGEGQILGQTREALRRGQELGTVGPALNLLFQQALRVGKRTRAETDIDQVAPTLVSAALGETTKAVGPVQGQYVVVVGAGAMAGLATATVSRLGAGTLSVVNRSVERGEWLASQYDAQAVPLEELATELGRADLVISCTGSAGSIIDAAQLAAARAGNDKPVALIDLALPHDIDRDVRALESVTLVGLAELAEVLQDSATGQEVLEVRRILGEEVTAFLAARRQASVTPTVVALRSMATNVVDAEMSRLEARLPDLDAATREEIRHAVRRVADKLLHEPTVRVKELANEQGAVSYAAALAELFALDPEAVDAVTRPIGVEEAGS
ncbi:MULTISPECIES: glutamyl-tRNA reductase [unclassified Nocardioides]|uniref:glutamyl-tRNA reductase n=1 Tax=unclassified Nocardioides TaxID=2615069 RepID=UPI0007028001|nr:MULTISPECIES: glutamyl-tRNA reductase [unclassified Nocardioides]KRC52782.1 glutamyl-tRNA reductase [Nocardioides sp. Root79]KRC72313.1 glutamyl-tRNA reductase [Nocardioides sp. Root240]